MKRCPVYYIQKLKKQNKGADIMKAWERLINYVTVRTPSDEESETVPSSVCQFDLARKLEKEMNELGLTEVVLDDKCYLYGKLPATEGKKEIPALEIGRAHV